MDTFSRHKEFSFRSIIQQVFLLPKKWGLPIKFLDGQALFLRFMIFWTKFRSMSCFVTQSVTHALAKHIQAEISLRLGNSTLAVD